MIKQKVKPIKIKIHIVELDGVTPYKNETSIKTLLKKLSFFNFEPEIRTIELKKYNAQEKNSKSFVYLFLNV